MNAVVATRTPVAWRPAPARIALLGTGTVGKAVLARLAGWEGTPLGGRLSLRYAANSRFGCQPTTCADALARVAQCDSTAPADTLRDVLGTLGDRGLRIVIDATASEAVTESHAHWLAQGIHVVTACKLGQGTSLARWRAIHDAQCTGRSRYGDSATVGAGLPLLRSIRALQAGGDRIHAIAGVLSGSLAWLFNHYDGLRPFSSFVRQARDAGYTEPDPRDDLSGEDVRRKLLILARAAGFLMEDHEADVSPVIPPSLASLPAGAFDVALPEFDVRLCERHAEACKRNERLRFIARLEHGKARAGLESLQADHPLATGVGTDNRVAIWSDRYCRQPLVIQGPGAGAEITAAALLDDVLKIASCG
ncbi:MAG: homoserine dehydrogenase [Lysobacter sp.]|nr:homoserine dehydrogenase [Lysobacter sp.]